MVADCKTPLYVLLWNFSNFLSVLLLSSVLIISVFFRPHLCRDKVKMFLDMKMKWYEMFLFLERGIFLNLKKTVFIIDAWLQKFLSQYSAFLRVSFATFPRVSFATFLQVCNFITKRLQNRCFLWNLCVFCEILRTAFLWTPLLATSGYYFGFQVSVWFFMIESFQ